MGRTADPVSGFARPIGVQMLRTMNKHSPWRSGAAAAAMLLLAGCASFSEDGGFGTVHQLTKERTGQSALWARSSADTDAAQARVAALLKEPLTADGAVELALLNNAG